MVNDTYVELSRPLYEDASFKIITKKDSEAIYFLRHSAAHLLAQAVLSLYPNALFGVGPAIEEGFYYDIMVPDYKMTEEDLLTIEKKMHAFKDQALPIVRIEASYEEAKKMFAHDKFKLDIIEQYKDDQLSFYKQGDFTDLCRGGHVSHTGLIKHFKLLSLAGAYFRGDAKNDMLTRVYGTAFFSEEDLQAYLTLLEERKARDHRKSVKRKTYL